MLASVGIERPLLVASARWSSHRPPCTRRCGTRCPSDRDRGAGRRRRRARVGGGSAIDTAKAPSAARGLPARLRADDVLRRGVDAVLRRPRPRAADGRRRRRRAHWRAIVYEPKLTLELPRARDRRHRAERARAHRARRSTCKGAQPEGDERALAGARLIADVLPRVLEDPDDLELRTQLLEGACARRRGARRSPASRSATRWRRRSAAATASPHGAIERDLPSGGAALQRRDRPGRRASLRRGDRRARRSRREGEELAALAGPTRLRDLGVPEEDLPRLGATAAGARRQPGEPAARDAGGSDRAPPFGLVKRLSDDLPPVSM